MTKMSGHYRDRYYIGGYVSMQAVGYLVRLKDQNLFGEGLKVSLALVRVQVGRCSIFRA